MGAFCVFGVSRAVCLAHAAKATPVFETIDGNKKRYLTVTEWGGRRDALARQLFETTTKVEKISPELDSPAFCRDWLAVAPSQVRDTKIMARVAKEGLDGKPIMRKGTPVLTWAEYQPQGGAE